MALNTRDLLKQDFNSNYALNQKETFDSSINLFPIALPYRLTRFNDPEKPIVQINHPIARGAFGYVYGGVRGKERVAIKHLGIKDEETSEKSMNLNCLPSFRASSHFENDEIPARRSEFNEILKEIKVIVIANQSPYCLSLIDIFFRNKSVFIVTEFCLGSLRDLCFNQNQPKLPSHLIEMLVFPIYEAVYHLHKHLILHLDIKCLNILISSDLTPKLCDFGACLKLRNRNELVKPKTRLGSVLYFSPEFLDERKSFGMKTDAWSLAVTLKYMYSGFVNEPLSGIKMFNYKNQKQFWILKDFKNAIMRNNQFEKFLFDTIQYYEKDRPSIEEIVLYDKYYKAKSRIWKFGKSKELKDLKLELKTILGDKAITLTTKIWKEYIDIVDPLVSCLF